MNPRSGGLAPPFTPQQQVTAVIAALALIITIVYLVRAGRLREEYSWLWLLTSAFVLLFTLRIRWLVALTHGLGAEVTASGAYFLALVFLVFVNLHASVKNSELTDNVRRLAQRLALTEALLEEHRIGSVSHVTGGPRHPEARESPHRTAEPESPVEPNRPTGQTPGAN